MDKCQEIILNKLKSMKAIEYELYREYGMDERYILSAAVIRQIRHPKSWYVKAEKRIEFGGLNPVHLRYIPSCGSFNLDVLSPGKMHPDWLVILISPDGLYARKIAETKVFNPAYISQILQYVNDFHEGGYSIKGIASIINCNLSGKSQGVLD